MEDQELLDLCKEVYTRMRWSDVDGVIFEARGRIIKSHDFSEYDDNMPECDIYPLYTTDYLMDKLLEVHYQLRVEHNHYDMTWYAYYAGRNERHLFDDEIDRYHCGDTPQKALLRLTIGLAKAGELKK